MLMRGDLDVLLREMDPELFAFVDLRLGGDRIDVGSDLGSNHLEC
jgi:hypothetical protein